MINTIKNKKGDMPLVYAIMFIILIMIIFATYIYELEEANECESACMAESDHFLVDFETNVRGLFGYGKTICKCFYANKVISFQLNP